MFRRSSTHLLIVLLVLALLAALVPAAMAKTGGKVSKFGVYSGYSEPQYDNWTRTSQYVEVRDGTRLAVDIFRPSDNGVDPVEDPLPVVFSAERYVRATYSATGDQDHARRIPLCGDAAPARIRGGGGGRQGDRGLLRGLLRGLRHDRGL